MIEYKFLEIKKLEESIMELDKLSNYEGWSVIATVGKKNNVLLLARQVEYPEPIQTPIKKGGAKRFPNAVYK